MIKKNLNIICPDCQYSYEVKGVEVGEILECPNCACEVELLSFEPLKYEELVEEK